MLARNPPNEGRSHDSRWSNLGCPGAGARHVEAVVGDSVFLDLPDESLVVGVRHRGHIEDLPLGRVHRVGCGRRGRHGTAVARHPPPNVVRPAPDLWVNIGDVPDVRDVCRAWSGGGPQTAREHSCRSARLPWHYGFCSRTPGARALRVPSDRRDRAHRSPLGGGQRVRAAGDQPAAIKDLTERIQAGGEGHRAPRCHRYR